MKTITLITTASLLLLTGCNNNSSTENNKTTMIKTVHYYLDHSTYRKERVKECRNLTTMTKQQNIDCNNAEIAEMKTKHNKLTDL